MQNEVLVRNDIVPTSKETVQLIDNVKDDLTAVLNVLIGKLTIIKQYNLGFINAGVENIITKLSELHDIAADIKNKTPQITRHAQEAETVKNSYRKKEFPFTPPITTKSAFFSSGHRRVGSVIVKNTSREIFINQSEIDKVMLSLIHGMNDADKSLRELFKTHSEEIFEASIKTSGDHRALEIITEVRSILAEESSKYSTDYTKDVYPNTYQALANIGIDDASILKTFPEIKAVAIKNILSIENILKGRFLNDQFIAWKDQKEKREVWINSIVKDTVNKTGVQEENLIAQNDACIFSSGVGNKCTHFECRDEFHSFAQEVFTFLAKEAKTRNTLEILDALLKIYTSLSSAWGSEEKLEDSFKKDKKGTLEWLKNVYPPCLETTKEALNESINVLRKHLNTPAIKDFCKALKIEKKDFDLLYSDLKFATKAIEKSIATLNRHLEKKKSLVSSVTNAPRL